LEPESAFTSGVRARNGKEGKSWRQKRTRTAIRQRLKPVQVGPIDISSSDNELELLSDKENEMSDQKHIDKARETFRELLHTEEVYVHKLQAIKTIREHMLESHYVRENNARNIMVKDITDALNPPGLESITILHSLTVLPQIRQKFDSGELLVGSILNDPKITPFFKVYSEFLSRKDTTCDPKISKIQKDTMYKEIYKWIIHEVLPTVLKEMQVLNLDSLLLEPVQRLPRYELLLKEYVKVLSKLSRPHSDLEYARSALKNIAETNIINNVKKKKAEDNDVLATLAKSISGMGTYVDGRRSLIKQIKNQTRRLTRIKKPEIRHCDILVLNDCIMIICDSQGRGSRFGKEKEVKHFLEFKGLRMELLELPIQNEKPPHIRAVRGLRLSGIAETVDLIDIDDCKPSESGLRLVQDDIEDAIKEYNKNRETFGFNRESHMALEQLGERAPRFMCSNDVSMCATCWKTFGSFGSSKNHCYACGAIVCNNCSNHSHQLKYKNDDKKRYPVCIKCKGIFSKEGPKLNPIEHFDDLWRQSRKQGMINVRKADQSEFHKCWCAILPLSKPNQAEIVEYGFLFSARKAPCDTCPVFERPLVGFQMVQSKPQNQREWLLKLGNEKLNIILEDPSSRDEWVSAIRGAIKISDDSYLPNQPVETYPRPVPQAVISSYYHQPAKNSTPNDTRFTPNPKEINQIPENSNQTYRDESCNSLHRNFKMGNRNTEDSFEEFEKRYSGLISDPIEGHVERKSDQLHNVKKPMRSKSLRATTSSRDDRQMDISGPLDYSPDHVGSGRVTKQMDSLDLSQHIIHRLSDRHTIHHNHNNQSQRFSNKSLDKTSSGSIDNFNHLFKKSISEEKISETGKSTFQRGINRISARFKMPNRLQSFVGTSKSSKSVSKTP